MLPNSWQDIRRLLVTQLGIEDVIQTVPALKTLRQLLPDTNITLMTTPACSQVALQQSWVDEVLVYESGVTTQDPKREITLIETLRDRSFDAAVIFTDQESPYPLAYICYLAGIPIRLGQSQEFGGGVLSQCVKPHSDPHPTNQHLFLLESVGFPSLHLTELNLKTIKKLKQH